MRDVIAEKNLWCWDSEGKRTFLTAQIGRPYPINETTYGCPVFLEGLRSKPSEIRGTDSAASLSLAVRFIEAYLADFIDEGRAVLDPKSYC